ncbi:unnamed protein product [Cylindrotheca closterium]|uniref:Uncharacterized protein n=1 Tax=Cylindrotheca closterium TaxID=2856 RepID=A0AAD2GA63_9STRA|nr:unnamed protein product [Cylindrotheca closterium]
MAMSKGLVDLAIPVNGQNSKNQNSKNQHNLDGKIIWNPPWNPSWNSPSALMVTAHPESHRHRQCSPKDMPTHRPNLNKAILFREEQSCGPMRPKVIEDKTCPHSCPVNTQLPRKASLRLLLRHNSSQLPAKATLG